MFLIEIAAYIFFITLIIFLATRALWLVFLLFCFRFWHAQLHFEFLSQYIPFKGQTDYLLFIILIAVATYFLVMFATKNISVARYIILLILVLYAFRTYELKDIFLFKDILKNYGLWGGEGIKEQLHQLFTAPQESFKEIFKTIWEKVWGFFARLWEYIAGVEINEK